uniref:G_PROTEIN_RECEP_F2_3 domain-containing protein n=1 Tax=Mesocestoides corti TaxID=53468 RepID=A0A5K3G1Q3_MESCO
MEVKTTNHNGSSPMDDVVAVKLLCEGLYKELIDNITRQGISTFCPAIYDGVMCWPPAIPNSTVYLPCPASFNGATYNA